MFNGSFTIFKKLADNIVYNESMKASLNNENIKNLEELEKSFNGTVNIVVTTGADKVGPFTIPGVSDILSASKLLGVLSGTEIDIALKSHFNQIKFTFQRFYDFFKEGVTINKSGNTFDVNTSFNNPITVYVPKWFLEDKIDVKGNIMELTDNMRVGIILHEIGHWTNNSMMFDSISYIIRLLGFLLGVFFAFKLFQNRTNNADIASTDNNTPNILNKIKSFGTNTFNKFKSNTLDPLKANVFYAITAIIGYILYRTSYVSNFFSTFNESNADSIAKKYGYGKDLADFVLTLSKAQGKKFSGTIENYHSFEVLFKEFITRLNSIYPSLEWRISDLVKFTETNEYLDIFMESEMENTSKLSSIISSMLIKFNELVMKLPALNSPILQISSSDKIINSKINENIALLINECK